MKETLNLVAAGLFGAEVVPILHVVVEDLEASVSAIQNFTALCEGGVVLIEDEDEDAENLDVLVNLTLEISNLFPCENKMTLAGIAMVLGIQILEI